MQLEKPAKSSPLNTTKKDLTTLWSSKPSTECPTFTPTTVMPMPMDFKSRVSSRPIRPTVFSLVLMATQILTTLRSTDAVEGTPPRSWCPEKTSENLLLHPVCRTGPNLQRQNEGARNRRPQGLRISCLQESGEAERCQFSCQKIGECGGVGKWPAECGNYWKNDENKWWRLDQGCPEEEDLVQAEYEAPQGTHRVSNIWQHIRMNTNLVCKFQIRKLNSPFFNFREIKSNEQ